MPSSDAVTRLVPMWTSSLVCVLSWRCTIRDVQVSEINLVSERLTLESWQTFTIEVLIILSFLVFCPCLASVLLLLTAGCHIQDFFFFMAVVIPTSTRVFLSLHFTQCHTFMRGRNRRFNVIYFDGADTEVPLGASSPRYWRLQNVFVLCRVPK